MNSNSFQEDLRYSYTGYDAAIKFLKGYFHSEQVEVINDLAQQKQGIDFKVILSDGKEINIDLKMNRADKSTIYLEEYSNRQTGKLGWLLSPDTKTDYYVFFTPSTGKFIIMPHEYALYIYNVVMRLPSLKENYYHWNTNSLGSFLAIPEDVIPLLAKGFTGKPMEVFSNLFGGEK